MNTRKSINYEKPKAKYYKTYHVEYWLENKLEFKKTSKIINIKKNDSEERLDLTLDEFNYVTLKGVVFDEKNIPAKGRLISIYKIIDSMYFILCDALTDSMGNFNVIVPVNINIDLIRIRVSYGQAIS